MKYEKVSVNTIYRDLTKIEKKFGKEMVKTFCAIVIAKIMWWNWPNLRDGFWEGLKEEGVNGTAE